MTFINYLKKIIIYNMQALCENYLEDEMKETLKNTKHDKHKTTDNSLLNKYILSSLTDFLVKFVPEYVE